MAKIVIKDQNILQAEVEALLASNCPILVAFSGGKDSIAMVLRLLEMGISKSRIHLHHHDVDGHGEKLFDWACTESYCKSFAQAMGLKLFFSYRKGGIARAIYRRDEPNQDVYFQTEMDGPFHCAPASQKHLNTQLKFPAVSNDMNVRWCSGKVKIDVLRTAIANNPMYQDKILIVTGERREESESRSKYDEYELHKTSGHKRKAFGWRMIIDMTLEEVWSLIERWKIQCHPAYELNWNRCSCQLCIFSSANIWAATNLISPEKVDRIDEIEKDINFTMYSKLSIRQKVAAGVVPTNLDPYWIAQATGEFTAPIFVDNWIIPLGAFATERAGAL